jgi:hypothetical protein
MNGKFLSESDLPWMRPSKPAPRHWMSDEWFLITSGVRGQLEQHKQAVATWKAQQTEAPKQD